MKTVINALWTTIPSALIVVALAVFGLFPEDSLFVIGLTTFLIGGSYAFIDVLFMIGLEKARGFREEQLYTAMIQDEHLTNRRSAIWAMLFALIFFACIPGTAIIVLFASLAVIHSCFRHWNYFGLMYNRHIREM